MFPPAPPWWVLCPQLCLPGWPSQARGRAGLAGGLTLSVMWAVSPVWQRRVDACLIDGNTAVRLSFLRLAPAVNIYPTFVLHQDDIAVLVMGENNNAQRPRTIASCEATPPPGHAPTRPRPHQATPSCSPPEVKVVLLQRGIQKTGEAGVGTRWAGSLLRSASFQGIW